jgi:hypothetical protein
VSCYFCCVTVCQSHQAAFLNIFFEHFKKFCTRQIPTWLGLVADNNKANCNCELCRADRENRHPNNHTVLEETLDYLMDKLPENWFNLGKKEDKDDKDPN